MAKELTSAITVAATTSALFEMETSKRKIRDKKGQDAYIKYMARNENVPLKPGPAFDVIKAMATINKTVGHNIFDLALLSTNHAWTGMRALRSCQHYDIPLTGGAMFGSGEFNPEYLNAYHVDWFISTNHDDAQKAHDIGIASCSVDPAANNFSGKSLTKEFNSNAIFHVVLDLDRVVFGAESDELFFTQGMDAYFAHEKEHADVLLEDGPFADMIRVLGTIMQHSPEMEKHIKISVITARGNNATLRAMNSLRKNGLVFNGDLHFVSGKNKSNILKIIDKEKSDVVLFLDDSMGNIKHAKHVVMSGRVPIDKGDSDFALGGDNKDTQPTPQAATSQRMGLPFNPCSEKPLPQPAKTDTAKSQRSKKKPATKKTVPR